MMLLKNIKKILALILITAFSVLIMSCNKNDNALIDSTKEIFNLEENVGTRKTAVVYFSHNDDTMEIAKKFAGALDAELMEIIPKVPYSEEDLDYNNKNSRIYLEDEFNPFGTDTILPDDEYETVEGLVIATKSKVEKRKTLTKLPEIQKIDVSSYPIIVLGFPVWYENAPKVVYSFIKDLKNKIIVPFCTGDEMGHIDEYLSNFADGSVRVMSGKRIDINMSEAELKDWVTKLSADFDIK